jgi:hypothetical protein
METMNALFAFAGRWMPPGFRFALYLTLAVWFAGAWTDRAYADRVQPDNTKTQFATPLPTPPVIDGVINTDEWAAANGATGNWKLSYDVNQTNALRGGVLIFGPDLIDANDLGAQIYAGYDADNLYIAVRVTDSALFDADSVELYLDPLNANAAAYTPGSIGGRYAIALNNTYAGSDTTTYGTDKAWYAQAARNDAGTGYDTEFRISLKSLSDPKFGDVLGLTVVVNDNRSGGPTDKTVDRQVAWVGAPDKPATYGNLILGHKSYTAPLVTKAPVIDGKIDANEYASAREIPINPGTGQAQTAAGIDTWSAGTFEAKAWVIHDATAVYVAVDVTDTNVVTDTAAAGSENGNTWEDDSVEIFFDADHDKTTAWGPSVDYEGQYVMTANGAYRDAEARNAPFGQDAAWYAATTLTAKGYQIEFKINKSSLLNPTNGMVMGFNIALNNDNGAGRIAQLSWNGDPHYEFTYGELVLAPPSAGELKISSFQHNANGSFTLTWVGGGTLQTAADLKGPWNDVTTATSPYTFNSSDAIQFSRIKR